MHGTHFDTIIERMYENERSGQDKRSDLASVLDQIADTDLARRKLDAAQAGLIAEVCDRWDVDEDAIGHACERLIQGGADGTAHIGEYLALELGPILRISPTTAAFRIADVLNLRDRHPLLWNDVQNLAVEYWQATSITRATRHLPLPAALWVDRQIHFALRTMPWRRVMNTLDDLITKADPALAAERARADRDRRMVRVGQYGDGGGTVYARLAAGDAAALDETLSDLANRLLTGPDDNTTGDQRRAVALGILAEPERAATLLAGGADTTSSRQTTLFVHLPAGSVASDDPDTIAMIDGIGALTRESLVEFLGTTRLVIRPVVDHNQIPAVDAYQVPPLMRQALTQLWPVEAFPYASRRSRGCDIDHSTPYDHQAPAESNQTRPDNLAPLSRKPHRARTGGGWHLEHPQPGIIQWRSRTGYQYQVTPTGTVSLGRNPSQNTGYPPRHPPTDEPPPDPPLTDPPDTDSAPDGYRTMPATAWPKCQWPKYQVTLAA